MAHNTVINPGSGGDTVVDYDLATGGAYPTTGKVPAGVVFVSATSSTAPTPVTAANGLYVQPGTSTVWNVVPGSPAAASYLPVRITDGSAFIGSGTEYTEGDTAATPKGSAVCWVAGTTVHAASTANPLPVSDAGGSFTVDAPVGTPAFVRLSDGTSAITTLAVSLASVPSHAVTNAGTFAVQATGTVTANIGTSGSLALDASVTGLQVAQASTTSGQKGGLALGAVTTAAPSYTTAQSNPLSLTTAGALRVDASATTQPVSLASLPALVAGTALVGKVGIDQTTVGTTNAVSLAQLGATTVATGNGVTGAGSLRVTVASDNTAFSVNAAQSGTWNVATVTTVTTCSTVTNLAQIGGQAVAMGTGVRSAGTQRVTIATDDVVPASQSGTWTVQPGNTANSTPWLVTDNPVTSGGLSMSATISAASTNATSVKASAGQVYAIEVFNVNAAARYLKLYNKASAPTVGTDTPVKVLTIPGNAAGAGMVISWDKGLAFGTGIAFALTTGVANSDTGAVAANELVVNIDYK